MFRRLQEFMRGRYGNDKLNTYLVIAAIIFSVLQTLISRIVPLVLIGTIFYFLQVACIIIVIYRALSRDISKRSYENERFLNFLEKFNSKRNSNKYNNTNNGTFYTTTAQAGQKSLYKYFKCPHCKVKLRVPKGKGKLTITCPKCKVSFKGKS